MCLIIDPEIARAIYERCGEQESNAGRKDSFAAPSPIGCDAPVHGQVRMLEPSKSGTGRASASGRVAAGPF